MPITEHLALTASATPVTPSTSALTPLPLNAVTFNGGIWGDLAQLNTAAILPHALGWVERLGWTTNFEDAASGVRYEHRGREFADSEIYKLVEALSWDTLRPGGGQHAAVLDRLIDLIASAQDPDGYLHTRYGRPWQQPRYSDFQWGHELYCFGHLIQASVANYRATGDGRLLSVATRLADHVCMMFGRDGLNRVCGHAEIEVALVELSRVTGKSAYLDQASIFVERRGEGTLPLHEFGRDYWQDARKVRDTTVLHGHAVRALYLAAGAVDVAVETGDRPLMDALTTQWHNTVARRTYITGGMGSHHMDEAFGDDFVLPPDRSYCETCAGVASIMFSWRLLLATGDVAHADLIERTLYNIVATSPARDGRAFFYANTLHQRTEHTMPAQNEAGVTIRGGASGRQEWYEVSCCPPNVARTLASLGAYVATATTSGVQIHQYAAGEITVPLPSGLARLAVRTDYPASGRVEIEVLDGPASGMDLALRVPGWAAGSTLAVGEGAPASIDPGYATVDGLVPGQSVVLELPITVRVTAPDDRIDAIRGTVAFERGPEVLALESIDLPTGWALAETYVDLVASATYEEGVPVKRAKHPDNAWPFGDGGVSAGPDAALVALVPYHSWAERGSSTMRIWIPVAP